MDITYHPIGIIHSPFHDIAAMPIQPSGALGIRGEVEIYPQFAAGLQDLDGFSHVILLYHFHRVQEAKLRVVPFMDSEPRGIFATRAPKRPNPLGMSVVRLLAVEGARLRIENVDVLDGTPLLDLKPYVPAFVHATDVRVGWLERVQAQVRTHRSDRRFQ